jgi:iron(III) transport system ATP-binding protein
VALARALAVEPSLVLLDEPFSSLDATLRASIRAEVREILRRAGATTVLVTHDQDEALSLADHVAVLREGRIVQHAPPHELYIRPVDAELARFLGEANFVEATASAGTAETPLGRVDLVAAVPGDAGLTGPATVMLRPEQIELRPGAGVPGAAGRVVGSDFHGHYTIVRVRLDGGGAQDDLVVRHENLVPVEPGTEVTLSVRGPVVAWRNRGRASDTTDTSDTPDRVEVPPDPA